MVSNNVGYVGESLESVQNFRCIYKWDHSVRIDRSDLLEEAHGNQSKAKITACKIFLQFVSYER